MKGIVRKLFADKGFGFIKAEGGGDYFFHRSELVNAKFEELAEGDSVSFEGASTAKGLKAEEVYVE